MSLEVGAVRVLPDLEPELSVDRILDTPPFPTWSNGKFSREKLEESVARLRSTVRSELDPRAMYRILPIDETTIAQYDPPDPLLEGDYVGTLLVTVGESAPDETDSGPMLDRLVKDAIQNVALTITKENVAVELRDRANQTGWNTTRLFSPGSGNVDWTVENSAFVFETLPADEIGVSLSDSGLIRPNKSSSNVLGMGPSIDQAPNLFTCVGCPRIPECDYARIGDGAAVES